MQNSMHKWEGAIIRKPVDFYFALSIIKTNGNKPIDLCETIYLKQIQKLS